MKKLFVLFFLIFLMGCNDDVCCTYEIGKLYKAYGYNTLSGEIEDVYVEYEILDYNDSFNLYTIHQNHLPLNFVSLANSNIKLLSSYVKENVVYYQVDIYVKAVDNFDVFVKLLYLLNNDLGYKDVVILYNNEILN